MKSYMVLVPIALALATAARAQEEHHHHPVPEHLGTTHLETSCSRAVTPAFDRAVALLHSFTYEEADAGFADVAARDPTCAMAHWGRAMTHYHQLWDVPVGPGLAAGVAEIGQAAMMKTSTPRERAIIAALGTYYANARRGSGGGPRDAILRRHGDGRAAIIPPTTRSRHFTRCR